MRFDDAWYITEDKRMRNISSFRHALKSNKKNYKTKKG